MTERVNENVSAASDSTSSGTQAPPSFEHDDLQSINERSKRIEDDNTFLRQQMASMQNSMDLLLARLPQQTNETPYMP